MIYQDFQIIIFKYFFMLLKVKEGKNLFDYYTKKELRNT